MTTWTEAEDTAIVALRAQGLSWVKVGLAIHRQPGKVRLHGQSLLGLHALLAGGLSNEKRAVWERKKRLYRDVPMPASLDPREAYCSGHPATWGAICSEPYPPYVSVR